MCNGKLIDKPINMSYDYMQAAAMKLEKQRLDLSLKNEREAKVVITCYFEPHSRKHMFLSMLRHDTNATVRYTHAKHTLYSYSLQTQV